MTDFFTRPLTSNAACRYKPPQNGAMGRRLLF